MPWVAQLNAAWRCMLFMHPHPAGTWSGASAGFFKVAAPEDQGTAAFREVAAPADDGAADGSHGRGAEHAAAAVG